MTAQQLKNSILQMAVQGKLVPQDPNDEPASVLLERIRTEKERLIKEKKIKREKNPSVIFKGADNTPYEKIGDEVRSLADEIPFDIPDSWEWVTLQTIATSSLGKTLDKAKNKGDLKPYLCSINVYWDGIDLTTVKETRLEENELPKYLLRPGDLLICEGGDVGRSAVWESTQEMYYQNALHRVRFYGEINPHYFQLLLECYKGNQILDAYSKGMTIKHLVQTALNTIVFPLPPLSEQTRIVDAVNRLLPYLHSYDRAEQKLSALNTGFPEALKKSILQEAVQGKLVPQDPSDEPAEALLGRIRAEKQRLIKEGKIKKDKHESVIFRRDNSHYEKRGSEDVCIDEEVPFEIPENWAWARLSSFGVFSSGKTPSMSNPQFWNGNVPWVTSKDMKRPVITDSEMHISELAASTMQLYPTGTLLLVARSGILKRILPLCKLGIDSTINQDIKAFSLYDIELSEWLFYGIKAFEPYILKELVKSVTTVESLKFDEFAAMLIPVPPLSEQRRIIAAIKAAMNLLAPLSSNPLFSL
ncbi:MULTISPECIES: restriction endonuclease subunit S [Dysosmobacter]|uniref:restriction endonuclease subunit S n=1 Tax=Dysosmobacter TaxID=2591381 RepID=UPI00210C02CD|nr:restriction endonuclease subunit S [Dysosmobacter welbionis]MCQ5045959.1 restriction endonuclease subunit S [Dysosmobacter welbionis]